MEKMRRLVDHFPKKHLHFLLLLSLAGASLLLLLPSPAVEAKKHNSLSPTLTSVESYGSPTVLPANKTIETETPVSPQALNELSLLQTTPTPAPEPAVEVIWQNKKINKGDNLSTLFSEAGLGAKELYAVVNADPKGKQLTNIHPGQSIAFNFNSQGEFRQLRYIKNPTETLLITKNDSDNSYQFEELVREYEIKTKQAQVSIQQSLFLDAKNAGMDDNLIMELATLFGWDIDFSLDIRSGDSFDIVYEELYLDGEKQKNGKILAANFFNQAKRFSAIYYEKANKEGAYFTENGASVRKEFTRSPVDFARVSSRFNLKRKHPIMHTIRAHKGVDYAASRGTPIKATGDGKVILAGRKGGYGKTVIIKHGQRYTTLYAHLNAYARGIRSGKRVRQGQIIGYVGSTGMATGPHLHYEFRVNGSHRNPLTVKLPRAIPLKGEEKQRFLAQTNNLRQQLLAFASQRTLAMNEF
jgi:murein DD-endopeptidase MepM/ murein hydrolase activator NlpD